MVFIRVGKIQVFKLSERVFVGPIALVAIAYIENLNVIHLTVVKKRLRAGHGCDQILR